MNEDFKATNGGVLCLILFMLTFMAGHVTVKVSQQYLMRSIKIERSTGLRMAGTSTVDQLPAPCHVGSVYYLPNTQKFYACMQPDSYHEITFDLHDIEPPK